MSPLSPTLRALLDEITAALATGGAAPEELLARLEALWRAERPDDLAALAALLASLRTRPDADALARAREAELDLAPPSPAPGSTWSSSDPADYPSFPLPGEPLGQDPFAPITRGGGNDEGWIYPVFFATSRAPEDPARPGAGFSSRRAERVTYGRCEVWVPTAHRFGETGRSWWRRFRHLDFADDHLRLKRTEVLSEAALWHALKTEMAEAHGPRHGLVFLHGYHVTFEEAAIRAAQIGFDLQVSGATAFFSWPSQGSLLGYAADAAAIEASEEAIAGFLVDFARQSGAEKVHLVAHSMGNRGLLRALQRIAGKAELAAGVRFGQVFLAAPDVDRDLFLSLAELYPRFAERATLYASNGDIPVGLSAWLHGSSRAGYLPPLTITAGVDTVVVPDFDLDLLGHSYFAQAGALLGDMHDLMRRDTPPQQRTKRLAAHEGCWMLRRA